MSSDFKKVVKDWNKESKEKGYSYKIVSRRINNFLRFWFVISILGITIFINFYFKLIDVEPLINILNSTKMGEFLISLPILSLLIIISMFFPMLFIYIKYKEEDGSGFGFLGRKIFKILRR